MRSLVLVVPFITGCLSFSDDERPAPLTDFRPLTNVAHDASVRFEHTRENLDNPDCLMLREDIEATLAGVPFVVETFGGVKNGNTCQFPIMRLASLPVAHPALLVIRDRTTTISCDLGDSLSGFPLELVPPGPWQVTAGERITVRATRPADTQMLVAELEVDGTVVDLLDQTQNGDDLTFTVPGPFTGTAELRVLAKHVYDSVNDYRRCGGFVFTAHHASTPITIAPAVR